LEPGYTLVLEGRNAQLIVTVLNETKTVDGVETRVVEERESRGGRLIEISRNYFAMSSRTNDVFYFGEDVDMYRGGEVVSHTGAWLSGVGDAKFGLMMPGQVSVNAGYYQEVAPKVAMDRAVIVSASETCRTPAGEFEDCLKVEETTPLQPGIIEYKYYAPGIGGRSRPVRGLMGADGLLTHGVGSVAWCLRRTRETRGARLRYDSGRHNSMPTRVTTPAPVVDLFASSASCCSVLAAHHATEPTPSRSRHDWCGPHGFRLNVRAAELFTQTVVS
jgi:hypothetical protein